MSVAPKRPKVLEEDAAARLGPGRPGILCVGLACADIVNTVEEYPEEDGDVAAIDSTWSLGGNAANTACVLADMIPHVQPRSSLGSLAGNGTDGGNSLAALFMGSLASDVAQTRIASQFARKGVTLRNCAVHDHGSTPTSYILRSQKTASRTIVLHHTLPELCPADWDSLDRSDLRWIHVEGNRGGDLGTPMRRLRDLGAQRPTVSVEVEKPATNEHLIALADYCVDMPPTADAYLEGATTRLKAFVGKMVAEANGFGSADHSFLHHIRKTAPRTAVIMTRGAEGAIGVDADGNEYAARPRPPDRVVDTLGAGDTFNAGVICALALGKGMQAALDTGCLVAGTKCGIVGFGGLSDALAAKVWP